MMGLAVMLDDLRIFLREVDVLATLTVAAYDKANWEDPDPGVVESIASLLGLIKKSAATASFAEIEAATLRVVATHTSRNLSHAAARLGMAPVSLSRWLGRRELPR